jgi:hypothetical protein
MKALKPLEPEGHKLSRFAGVLSPQAKSRAERGILSLSKLKAPTLVSEREGHK